MEPRGRAGDPEGEIMSVPGIQKMLIEVLGEAEGEYLFGCSGLQCCKELDTAEVT